MVSSTKKRVEHKSIYGCKEKRNIVGSVNTQPSVKKDPSSRLFTHISRLLACETHPAAACLQLIINKSEFEKRAVMSHPQLRQRYGSELHV